MKKGDKFPVPTLEYDDRGRVSQEGRHRSMAVMKLQEDGFARKSYKMPVIIVKNV